MINKYLSLVKFSHTIFAMPFALIGFFLGVSEGYSFSWHLLIPVLLCMVFARNAAMAFNRYIDRSIDLKNPRTVEREIPSKQISPNQALIFVITNSILFVLTTYFINTICFYLSPIALIVILGYSLTKRFTFLCHFILGLGLSLAPIGAYLAVTGVFNWLPILFSLTVITWVSGFDIIYSLQDSDFDKSLNLWSVPVVLGTVKSMRLSVFLHLLTAITIVAAGYYYEFGWLYWLGVLVFNVLLVYQHLIIKPNDLSRINLAFFTTNGIASVLFGLLVVVDLLY